MRYSMFFLALATVGILSISCDSVTEPTSGEIPEGNGGTDGKSFLNTITSIQGYYSSVWVVNHSSAALGSVGDVSEFSGYFLSDTTSGTKVDAGTLTIASQSLSKITDANGQVTYQTSTSSISATNGVNAVFSLQGNSGTGVPPINDSMYVPRFFSLTSPTYDVTEHAFVADRSSGVTVTWNTDSNVDSVYIEIRYDDTNPSQNFGDSPDRYWWIKTSDDGSYSIPSSVVDDFTSDESPLLLSVFRYKYKAITINNKQYLFTGASSNKVLLKLID